LASSNAAMLVDLVCETPIVSSRTVQTRLGVTRPTALKLLRQLEEVGVLEEGGTGARGQRRYLAGELMVAVADDAGTGQRRSDTRA
ncbi:MAG TPA: helix-turn-helix domain-containing protein, partial [Solirubrobacteraceae bacterium]|nr:helix-turn-helix domain-containing protein [Solirubrobacteraceae bacterium]